MQGDTEGTAPQYNYFPRYCNGQLHLALSSGREILRVVPENIYRNRTGSKKK
jgi:hypothetical protein